MADITQDQKLEIIQLDKRSGFNYRQRRHPEWTENYALYRDRVIMNRLTQRQSVNVPVMKSSLNTLRKDIDDAPALYFHSLDGDAQKEVFYNESFKYYMREAKGTIKDIHDKNNGMLFGRTFKMLNIVDGMFDFDVVDAQDINIDRYVPPAKIDGARHLIHEHIYKSLSWVRRQEGWDQKEITKLSEYFATEEGLIKSTKNAQDAIEKNERMQEMGVPDVNDPVLGETYLEINLVFKYEEDPLHNNEEILHLLVVAEDAFILFEAPLCEVLGETEDEYWHTHYPYSGWGVDPDATDFWCDGIADILRMTCKIINSWFSQEVENRTLQSFGMNFYDSTNKAFVPQTFQPIPFGFFPVPGDPNKVLKSVFPNGLKTNVDGIKFLMEIAQTASSATATLQGETQNNVTLGDIKLSLVNAQERVRALGVFYNDSWLEFGIKYTKLIEGSSELLQDVKIIKKGRMSDKHYSKIISPKDSLGKQGYHCEVKTVTDKDKEDVQKIQKLQASKQFFPTNNRFNEILQKKAAEFAGLNAEEIQQVMEEEKKQQQAQQAAIDAANQNGGQPALGSDGQPLPPPPTPPNGAPALPANAGGGVPTPPPMQMVAQ